MKSSVSQAVSAATSAPGRPPTSAWNRSGYCEAEWLPQMVSFLMSATGVPVLAATCESARLWSRRVIAVNRVAGTSGAFVAAMSALVFAGLPTTSTRTSSAAPSLMARPCGPKMPPLASSRSARSIPGAARAGADEEGHVDAVEGLDRVVEDLDAGQGGEGAVVQLHRGALCGGDGLRDLEEAEPYWRVRAEHLARGYAEEQRVPDLASGSGDGDIHGFSHGPTLASTGPPRPAPTQHPCTGLRRPPRPALCDAVGHRMRTVKKIPACIQVMLSQVMAGCARHRTHAAITRTESVCH